MKKEPWNTAIVEHPAGMFFGCAKCRKVLQEGAWAVGLRISNLKYLVGHNPPLSCCGEEKKVVQVFLTEDEAKKLCAEVEEILRREGTTEKLVLYEFHQVISTATH